MSEAFALSSPAAAGLRDVVDLAKPRITTMVVFTTAMGLWAAPDPIAPARAAILLFATALLVASANVFNSWYERDSDALMQRTRQRPIPAGRVDPWTAFALAALCGAFAVPLLAIAINPLTALLGAIAHGVYVLVYTPLKRITPWALEIGAVPGAIPPLMGWAAATGRLNAPGWVLFGILFFWQLPHFIAISIYLKEDYARGGLRVLPVAQGEPAARARLLAYTAALAAVSFAAIPLLGAGVAYGAVAAVLAAAFLVLAAQGVVTAVGGAWARRTMLYSLVYLVTLVTALVLDAR
jgi:protoheme IX farnesyltransferase